MPFKNTFKFTHIQVNKLHQMTTFGNVARHYETHTLSYNYYIKEKIYHNKIKETYSNLFVFARKQKHKFSVGLLTKW